MLGASIKLFIHKIIEC